MPPYRCYLLDAASHIAKTSVIECGDDDDAKRQARQILAIHNGYHTVEVWNGARRVDLYPADERDRHTRTRRRTALA